MSILEVGSLCSCENPDKHIESLCLGQAEFLREVRYGDGDVIKYPYCENCVKTCLSKDNKVERIK